MRDDANAASTNILQGSEGARQLTDNVMILPAQGNALAVKTADGIVLVDSGSGRGATAKMIAKLREWSDLPVKAICYSHGHAGYNDGAADWLEHARLRGEEAPALVGHVNVKPRYDRYRETAGLQDTLNRMQFPQFKLAPAGENLMDPTVEFFEHMVLNESDSRIELFWAPSETDDVLALWLPEECILYAGAAFPGTTLPNVGTPLRTQRLTIRWAETLERLDDLNAETLIQEFGPVIDGAEAVRQRLGGTAEALRWLRDEVVERMNKGMNDLEIIHDLECPPELFDQKWMRERYGAVEYLVRDIFREENGWWDRNPTSLHPIHPDQSAAAILDALGDPRSVIDKARGLSDAGETQMALHVIDLIALAPGDDPVVVEARVLKADLCRQRAEQVRPYVSKALYETSARLLDDGKRRWSEAQ